MEYSGTITSRKVDQKRRLSFPSKWLEKDDKKFLLVQDEEVKIYPYQRWKVCMSDCVDDEQKLALAAKSTVISVDAIGRILLPKEYVTWKKVDLIGLITHIVIRKSAV